MSHLHFEGSAPCTEIAPDVCIREVRNDAGDLTAFDIAHDSPGRERRCEGRIPVGRSEHPTWEMTGTLAGGDLTLTPSVLEPPDQFCPGQHGFVTNGHWVPA